ncbi:MAG: hypothetical protein PHI32_08250 [Dysgonamonadaceae bacterium]|nr:hypothetical protein [Dysgonamonadaceae bacterium]
MKHNSTVIAMILITSLGSCQNKKPESKTKAEIDIVEIESEVKSLNNTFDWSIPHQLKKQLVSNLKNKPNEIDNSIILFLDEYEKLRTNFNEILFDLNNYDSLNEFAFKRDTANNKNAYEFYQLAENNGFIIASSEGMIYLAKNTDYIKSDLAELIDSTSIEFLNLYCQEIENVCCEDAAIIISEQELVKRAFLWGNLLEKTHGLEYQSVAESEFNNYLSLIFNGLDNTPSFEWQTKKFNKTRFNLMIKIIETHPDSKASKIFKEFTQLLVSEDFKQTDKIDEYLMNI